MSKIFEITGILAWILCFAYEVIYTLKNNNSQESYFKDFKKKALQIIRLDKLFLISILIIYIRFKKDFVTSLRFTVICLYMYINKLYEKSKKEKLLKTITKNWLTLIIVVMIAVIPFIYFVVSKKLENTYIILLIYIFINYFIVGIASIASGYITKKKR